MLSPKPYYLATSEAMDDEMKERIARHKAQRANKFICVEEPLKLYDALNSIDGVVLLECLSVWINNMLYYKKDEADIISELKNILTLKNDIIFVINDVSSGIIPDNALARRFIDISGRVAQLSAEACDEVYFCVAGLSLKMK